MCEISSLDHLVAKIDALTQKFDKMNTSAVTPGPVSPPCEVCGVFGHIGIECQLGSVVYNQGMRPNQNFYNQTPQNPFGQTTPPSYANNQRVLQKFSLELLVENFLMDQSKHYEELKNQTGFLKDSLTKLTSKADSIATHNKMLETQKSLKWPNKWLLPLKPPESFLIKLKPTPKVILDLRAVCIRA